jgi:hypothetical protein
LSSKVASAATPRTTASAPADAANRTTYNATRGRDRHRVATSAWVTTVDQQQREPALLQEVPDRLPALANNRLDLVAT